MKIIVVIISIVYNLDISLASSISNKFASLCFLKFSQSYLWILKFSLHRNILKAFPPSHNQG